MAPNKNGIRPERIGEDRRASRRRRVDLKAWFDIEKKRLHVWVRDLSECGAFLSLLTNGRAVTEGEQGLLVCQFPKPIHAAVRLEVEVVREEKQGFAVRLLNLSAANRERLRPFLHATSGRETAARIKNDAGLSGHSDAAGKIFRSVLEQWLPGAVDSVQEAMLDRLWNASDAAASDAERTALSGDIAMFGKAVQNGKLIEQIRRGLLSAPVSAPSDFSGKQQAEPEEILQLVDPERFEIELAGAALANGLTERLRTPLTEIEGLARSAFGPSAQFSVDPTRVAKAFEAALSGLELTSFAISLCLREASAGLGASLESLYAELSSAWKSLGLVARSAPKAPERRHAEYGVLSGRKLAVPAQSGPLADAPRATTTALRNELRDWLCALPPEQRNAPGLTLDVKEQLKALLYQGSASVVNDNARLSERIDSSDRVLANMLEDNRAPSDVKRLIDRLSNRFVSLALSDNCFFRDASHPIVNIIDQLEQLSALVPESGLLNELAERTVATDVNDLKLLRSLAAEIESLVERHSGEFQHNVELLVASLEGKERLREVRAQVRHHLNRSFAGRMMHRAVAQLINEGWRVLLEMVVLRQGFESPSWERYWQTLLCVHRETGGSLPRGVEPSLQRAELGASLREGLDFISFNPFKRGVLLDSVTAAMDTVHTQRTAKTDFVAFPGIAGVPEPRAPSVEQPVDLSDEAWRQAIDSVDRLEIGSRLELTEGGKKQTRFLVWRSDDGSQLVFADGRGRNSLGLNRDQLAAEVGWQKAKIQPAIVSGITERAMDATLVQMNRQITTNQEIDPLTGLATRGQLFAELTRLMSADPDELECAIFGCLAPDHFEEFVGSSGYAAGDNLLRTIGQRLNALLPEACSVAYLGNNRFGFLLSDQDSSGTKTRSEEVHAILSKVPIIWNGNRFPLAISMGVTRVADSSSSPDRLLSVADTACTAARRAGGDRVILFRESDDAIVRERATVDGWIKAEEVVRSKRIRLRCQSIFPTDPALGGPHHHEILLSVFDQSGAPIPLMDFINSAEAFHRMQEVDRLVIEKALSWVKDKPDAASRLGGIAINLSGQSLGNEKILDQIHTALQRSNIDPRLVGFEVTETAAIANVDQAVTIIDGIRAMGCRFALDDFGTGLSSYAYLKRLPVDYLKIDGSFVRDMLSNPSDEVIVKSINEVAHFMGKMTIAEFVCDERIRDRLQEIGVDYVQGYAVAKPVYLEEA